MHVLIQGLVEIQSRSGSSRCPTTPLALVGTMSLYVVLEEKIWQNLAVGHCTEEGEVLAVLDPHALRPMPGGLQRDWEVVSAPVATVWAAPLHLRQRA